MGEPESVETSLPELDRSDDPRGGAVAWALLAVGLVLLAGAVVAMLWVFGAW